MEFLSYLNWIAVGQIVLIDILLGGDNAIVIALACRKLPQAQRRAAIIWGTSGAIVLRIALTMVATNLLSLPYLRIFGAGLLLWIGVRLILPDRDDAHQEIAASDRLLGAVKTVIMADLVMSLDNVVGVAAAAKGSFALIIFGLLFSIPLIVWGSRIVLHFMDRFPVIIAFGGALLGWIAGELVVTDPVVKPLLEPYGKPLYYASAAAGAVVVLLMGRVLGARRIERAEKVLDLAKKDDSNSAR